MDDRGRGPGRWEYGFREEDGTVWASHSGYHREPFLTAEEARRCEAFADGEVVRRWVPAPGDWERGEVCPHCFMERALSGECACER